MTAKEFAAVYEDCDFERKRILSGLMHVCMAQKLLTVQEMEDAFMQASSAEHKKVLVGAARLCKKQMELDKKEGKNGNK